MVRAAMIALALVWSTISIPASAQLPSSLPQIAPHAVATGRYPALEVTFPNGARGMPGVTYREPAGYRPLNLDLYLPPASVAPPHGGFPLVVYVHGGGWMGGDPRKSGPFVDFPGVLARLAAKGYVVASIEYRLSSEAKFPAQARDVKAAVRWLRLNASKYAIDPSRAVVWGASAGGHLAALAATSCGAAGLEPGRTQGARVPDAGPDPVASSGVSDCVQGAVVWYGVFDMATIAQQARLEGAMSHEGREAPEWALLGCFGDECTPEQIAAASPVAYVDRNDPPMLLIVGDRDTTVPRQQTLEMAEKLKAEGVRHELMILPGVGHGFIGASPDDTTQANLEALSATFRFIRETVGSAGG